MRHTVSDRPARPARGLRRLATATAGLLLAAGLSCATLPAAQADSAPGDPADPATPVTVSATGLPTAQMNGVAWSQVVVGNTVYVGGSFTKARPPGAAAGTNEVDRTNAMAYDITTGQMTSWAPVVNGQVRSVAVSPDGTRLYLGGEFTSVNGQARSRIAAFDTATGNLISSFAPPVGYHVYSIVATNQTVYAGGDFTSVGTRARGYLAAFNAANGALLDWAPQAAGGKVWAITMSPDRTRIAVGGQFTSLNGAATPGYGLGMVDAVSGASLPMAVNTRVRNGGADAAITSLTSDGENVYGGGYTFGGGGTFEGVFAASWDGGTTRWINDCHGDTYSVFAQGDAVYAAGHAHYCGNIGGFPQTDPDWSFYRGIAFGKQATGTATREPYGYTNYQGEPTSSLLTWFPSINAGTYTGLGQGPWSVAGNADYIVYGGEFTRVNSVNQQGLVRFPVAAKSTNNQGPRLFSTTYPLNLTSTETGTVRINWGTNHDPDNDNLTYRVYRDVQQRSGLVYETTRRARFWEPYTLGFTDTGLEPGSTHQYRVAVTDPFGNIANSPWTSVTVASSGTDSDYVDVVRASQPVDYWRMGDPTGTTARDSAGFSPLTSGTGVTEGTTGAIAGDADKAMTFNGQSTGIAYTSNRISPPQEFTLETWFRTNATVGGKLIGFGNRQNTNSGSYDRQVYIDNSGRISFGVYNGTTGTITTTGTYRDNRWHHVAASLTRSGGMRLYVDGQLIGTRADVTFGQGGYWGWWRIGGDTVGTWPNRPTSNFFRGDLDEVAIYHRGLSDSEVSTHYAVGTGAAAPNQAPTASFTASTSGLTASVDASASADADGTVASYAWDFGDGTTGTGRTASRTYAASGTYTVRLTVTDDDGATDSVTRQVTVEAPNQAPSASFTASTSGLTASVDASASADADGTVASYAWDFGDGTTGTGRTASRTYAASGTYTVRLTVTDDDGATDSVTRQVSVAAPNQAPTASFAGTANGLAAAFDASASTDPDGTVASYAWDFGDGTTGTGRTASRTYAAAGTYTVTLTVTDDDGATDQQAQQISVAAAPSAFARDEFARTVTDGWGTSDLGGAWSRSGSATNYAVTGGVGTIRMGTPGAGPSVSLPGVSSASTDLRVVVGNDKAATGGGIYTYVRPRVVGSDRYSLDLRQLSNGTMTMALVRTVGGVETGLVSRTLTGTVAPGDRFEVRVQAVGTGPTTLRAKVWRVGTAEPTDWMLTATDASASLQAAGAIGLGTYLSGSATNAPVLAAFDDLRALPVG